MKLREMHVGRGTTRAGLTVFPVWTPVAVPNPGYVTAAHPSLSVSEMPDGASVGRLQVENRSSRPVLLCEGALIEGIRPINPLDVLDIVLLHRKSNAFIMNTWTL